MSIYKELKRTSEISLKIIVFVWLIYFIDFLLSSTLNFHLSQFGIIPRSFHGLYGIVLAPFLHGSFRHLLSNTVPLFILLTIFITFYKKRSIQIIPIAILMVGILTWVIGRKASHIGASGFIYFLASFLFFAGIFQKKLLPIAISIIVLIFYGGMFWGIFPSQPYISWEGHFSGFLTGSVLAYLFKSKALEKDEPSF